MLNANSFDPDCSQIFEEVEECQVLSELNEEIDLNGYVEEDEDFKFSAYELESESSSSSDDDKCGVRLTKKKCWTTMESGANVEQRLTRKKFIFYINLN